MIAILYLFLQILLPVMKTILSLCQILLLFARSSLSSLQILLPVQRRAAGDPIRDEGPPARAASPQEVLRGHQLPALLAAAGDRGHDLCRRGARPVQQPRHSCQGSGEKEECLWGGLISFCSGLRYRYVFFVFFHFCVCNSLFFITAFCSLYNLIVGLYQRN